MANPMKTGQQVPLPAVVAAVVFVLAVIGFFAFKTFSPGGSLGEQPTQKLDLEKIKRDFHSGGLGGH